MRNVTVIDSFQKCDDERLALTGIVVALLVPLYLCSICMLPNGNYRERELRRNTARMMRSLLRFEGVDRDELLLEFAEMNGVPDAAEIAAEFRILRLRNGGLDQKGVEEQGRNDPGLI